MRADQRGEEWRNVEGFPGYLVSSQGRAMSTLAIQPRILSFVVHDGYRRVELVPPGGKPVVFRVHRLVATAFHGPCPEGMECRHLNGDRQDNQAENLRWGTRSENQLDRVAHGRHKYANQTHCVHGHAFEPWNTQSGKRRRCRTCMRRWSREHKIRRAMRAANVPEMQP